MVFNRILAFVIDFTKLLFGKPIANPSSAEDIFYNILGAGSLRNRPTGSYPTSPLWTRSGKASAIDAGIEGNIAGQDGLLRGVSAYRLTKRGDADIEAAAAGEADRIYQQLMGAKSPGEVEFVRPTRKTHPDLANMLSQTEYGGVKFDDFIEDDADAVAYRFMRANAGDIASFKVFGTHAPYETYKDEISKEFEKSNEGYSGKELGKRRSKQARLLLSLQSMDAEVRGLRGAGEDTKSYGWRIGKQMQNYIVMTTGGMIGLTSVMDVSQFILHFGLRKFLNAEFRVLRRSMQNLVKGELFRGDLTPGDINARKAGGGIEYAKNITWSRVWDIARDDLPQNRFERASNAATTAFGYLAGYVPITNHMKRLTGEESNREIMLSVGKLLGAYEASPADRQRSIRFLARIGITPAIAEDIWRQLTEVPGGGTEIDGIWEPNMAVWDNPRTQDAVWAGGARIVNNSAITPGLEVYTWVTRSWPMRLLATYKRFAISSTIKLLRFSDQEALNRPVNTGIWFATLLALGAMNWYTKQLAAGGSRWEQAQDADLNKWIYEAVLSSGLLAIGQEPINLLGRTPLVDKWLEPAGESTRTVFGRPFGQLGGVAEGKIYTADRFVSSLGNPGASTIRTGSKLIPFRNHALLARAFTGAENVIIDEFNLDKRKRKGIYGR